MKVISPTAGRTSITKQGLGYFEGAVPDYSGLISGLNALAAGVKTSSAEAKAKADAMKRYNAATAFQDFQTNAQLRLLDEKKAVDPASSNAEETLNNHFDNYAGEFLKSIDPELQPEYGARVADYRGRVYLDNRNFAEKQMGDHWRTGIADTGEVSKGNVAANPDTLEDEKAASAERIGASGLSDIEKEALGKDSDRALEGVAYKKNVEKHLQYSNDLRTSIIDAAAQLGVSPLDLATVISYETSGTFSTNIRGGKNNRYIGLIQFGDTEQKQYGAYQGQNPKEQMAAVVRYLTDRGFKPGMGILDLYSTINAGQPGRYGASDSPGNTVASHVAGMGEHQKKAAQFLGGEFNVADNLDSDPRYSNVLYEDRISMRKDAETNVNQQIAAQTAAAKADYASMFNTIKNGAMDGTVGQTELDDLYHSGKITDAEDRASIQSIIDKRTGDSKWAREGAEKLLNGGLWSFTSDDDKKRADALFGEKANEELATMGKNAPGVLREFVNKTKMIPPSAIDTLNGMLASADGRQVLFAADTLSQLRDVGGLAYNTQVNSKTNDAVDTWLNLKDVLPEKELLDAIRPGFTPEQRQAKTTLDKIFDEAQTKANDPNFVSFDTVLQAFDPGVFADQPVDLSYGPAQKAMHAQWVALNRYNFVKTNGNVDAAQKISLAQLQRTWGNTEVGGTRKLMALPPEKFVPTVDGSHSWIEDQARSDFRLVPGHGMELISDNTTASEVANGKQPSYKIAVEEDGVWSIIPNRFAPTVTPAMRAKEAEAFRVREKIKTLQELYVKQDEADRMEQITGVPKPTEIHEQIEDLKKQIEGDQKKLETPVQGPKYKAPGSYNVPKADPMPARKARDEEIKKMGTDVGAAVKRVFTNPPIPDKLPGFTSLDGETFYEDIKSVPEGTIVRDDQLNEYVKKNGYLAPRGSE